MRTQRLMIDIIDILHKCHCSDFTGDSSKEASSSLCVITYHHKRIVELIENSFNPFAELFISPGRFSIVLLVQSIGNLQRNVCCLKEADLNFLIEIIFISENQTIAVFILDVIEPMNVIYTGRSEVKGMDYTTYSTVGMEFIAIIIGFLRRTINPIRHGFNIIRPHCTSVGPYVWAHPDRFGINAEHILASVYMVGNVLLISSVKRQSFLRLALNCLRLMRLWQIMFTFFIKTVKR